MGKAPNVRGIALMFVITLVLGLYMSTHPPTVHNEPLELKYSRAVQLAKSGRIMDARIEENNISGTMDDGTQYITVRPSGDAALIQALLEHGKDVEVVSPSILLLILMNPLFLTVLSFVFIFFLWKMMSVGATKNLGKVFQARSFITSARTGVTFQDVAGVDEAKANLQEIVQFLKNPIQFTKLGGRMPSGVLMVGPSGTGKTLLARAVAGEAGVPFFSLSGSDFVQMFVGVGASRVRDLFQQGKKHAPCIIFIDEIDAVGRQRGMGYSGGHDEREQTLNQLLVEMDGFENKAGVMVIAATNRPDILDSALLRPGRFDRRIMVAKPTVKGRMEILKIHTKKIPLEPDIDFMKLAQGTPGFTGADLENMANEAALFAARTAKERVSQADLWNARDKTLMGEANRDKSYVTEVERISIAYHESGHALVAIALKPHGADPVHKISIISRGLALGVTQQLPEDAKKIATSEYLKGELAILMGGRTAEKIKLRQLSTGAANDLEKATELAMNMVCTWGMSETIGPRVVMTGGKNAGWFTQKEYSQHLEKEVDMAVRKFLRDAETCATKILTDLYQKGILDRAAKLLLEKEEVDGVEFEALLNP